MLLKDVARIELGAENYNAVSRVNGHPGSGIAISTAPGADALKTAELDQSDGGGGGQGEFLEGFNYAYANDTTEFIKLSIDEVVKTLGEAIALVVPSSCSSSCRAGARRWKCR